MRPDVTPGAVFPDYELSDHTGKHRKLSEAACWALPRTLDLHCSEMVGRSIKKTASAGKFLFVAQRDHRINAHRPPCGNPRGTESYCNEGENRQPKHKWVVCADLK